MVGGDQELQALIDHHHGRLIGLLRLRGCSAEEAEDLAHDALLRLVERWSAGPPVANWWAWLATVAINLHVSHWRRVSTANRRGRLAAVSDTYYDENAVEALDLLAPLSIRQRTAVVLRYYAGLSVRETAEAMGVAEGTVKSLAAAGREAARAAAGPLHQEMVR